MTRTMLMIASALLVATVPVGACGNETTPAVAAPAVTRASVPLPIARPVWSGRQLAAGDTAGRSAPQRPGQSPDNGVAPAPDGTGLKSGSSEALAVQLEGAQLLSSEGEVVGQVERVVDEPGNGRQAVVSVGGFLGIGARHVAIPAENLVPSGKGVVRTSLTGKQLRSMPAYNM